MNDIPSHILVCPDIEKAYEYVQEQYSEFRICPFIKEKDDFLLEDAKAVVKEAYIAEIKPKILVLGAKGYRVETQNSLLKILEEPPRNIIFIVIVPIKTVLLPTIRSRLSLKELKIEKTVLHSGLNLKNLCEKDIFEFVQANSRIDKNQLKDTLQNIVSEAVLEHSISFTHEELSHFQTLLELAQLNSRPQNLLFTLLISIMKRKRD
ncbi:DNA polymerase III subunit delta' [Sulfurospirillum arcachonense]|uniref:DNA polymerase III subunit delta' n=1 Tax=Sulfurospirillum arcachonense TaxID=57666 RepID=UPI0004694795|nr:DNA polymerase III subunit delta' [Sulfurospirillum arcachonense]